MNVAVALEQRFLRLPDGSVWTQAQCAWPFWRRYLDVFDHVRCVARVQDVAALEGQWHRADGPGVTFSAIPHYVGIREFVTHARQVRRAIHASISPGDAIVLRVPGNIGRIAWSRLQALKDPYGVEVLGDPYHAFAPGAIQHPLRGVFRWQLWHQLRMQCAGACAASYVSGHVLPRRYPAPGPAVIASSIELPDASIAREPRAFDDHSSRFDLVFVGSIEQYYKAPDVLIRAVAAVSGRGHDVHLTIIGDGKHRSELEALACALGCGERVRFTGQLPSGSRIFAELDAADIFVLPSRSEGLPRAMLEAMARGLPCIGSDAGGIPELLEADAVPAGDVTALASRISAFIENPALMNRMAARNLESVRAYRSVLLQQRRVTFYRRVREATDAWMAHQRICA